MIDITDRKRAEEKLRISEEEYRIATQHSNKLIVRLTFRQNDIPPVPIHRLSSASRMSLKTFREHHSLPGWSPRQR